MASNFFSIKLFWIFTVIFVSLLSECTLQKNIFLDLQMMKTLLEKIWLLL